MVIEHEVERPAGQREPLPVTLIRRGGEESLVVQLFSAAIAASVLLKYCDDTASSVG